MTELEGELLDALERLCRATAIDYEERNETEEAEAWEQAQRVIAKAKGL